MFANVNQNIIKKENKNELMQTRLENVVHAGLEYRWSVTKAEPHDHELKGAGVSSESSFMYI